VSKPDGSLSAVVVSGGKQYRVAPGDQILVDRIAAEPGSSLKLGRVLLFHDGKALKVGAPAVDGIDVEVKVLAHRRGPRIESLRYKSKKRVRVHRGGRADLTALEIVAVGGITAERAEQAGAEATPAGKAKRAAKPAKAVAAASTKAEIKEEKVEEPVKKGPRRARATKSKEETN
jgi:large subunit ribosomal protein L21